MLPWWLGMIIYSLIITIIIVVLFNKYGYVCFDNSEKFLIWIFTVFALLFISFIGIVYTDNNKDIKNKEIVEKNKKYIYSIEDNININGSYSSFIIGSGYIGENLYYYTLIGNYDGYILKKFKAEDTYLVLEDNVKPYYCKKYQICDYNYPRNIIFGYMFNKLKPNTNQKILIKKELHLPRNYIKQNYNIDLK